MNTPVLAVSLDLDNTLWDTPPVLLQAEATLRQWLSCHAPRVPAQWDDQALAVLRQAVVREAPSQSHDMTFIRLESLRRVMTQTGYPEAMAQEAFDVFLHARNQIILYPEVEQALAALAARVPLFAVTNGNACVKRVGIGHYFTASIDAATVGAAKPDPRVYAALLGRAQLPAAAILHVGDDAFADVTGARAAGIRSVWMNRTGGLWPAELVPADHEVTTLSAVVELVDRLGVEPAE